MLITRRTLRVDCCATLVAGVAVLPFSAWFSQLHALPQELITFIGKLLEHNQAMHRMPKPPLRCGFVTGDGGRYAVESFRQIQTRGGYV